MFKGFLLLLTIQCFNTNDIVKFLKGFFFSRGKAKRKFDFSKRNLWKCSFFTKKSWKFQFFYFFSSHMYQSTKKTFGPWFVKFFDFSSLCLTFISYKYFISCIMSWWHVTAFFLSRLILIVTKSERDGNNEILCGIYWIPLTFQVEEFH